MGDGGLILLVEDEPSHAQLVEIAFEECAPTQIIRHVSSGEEALDCLFASEAALEQGEQRLPALVLLDLRMPRMSGFEVLEEIGRRGALAEVPVVVLSSSASQQDMDRAYKLGARDYVVKPSTLDDLIATMTELRERWVV